MMTVGYVEGTAQAVVRGDTVLLLPQPVEPEVVTRLWEALEAPEQGGVVSVVGALTDVAGSLTAVPPFAVVTLDARAREARVAVRGTSAAVRVRAAGGDVEVSGAGVLMWAERVVEDVASVELALDPGPAGDGPVWPLQGGVVRAALLRRSLDGSDAAGATPASAPAVPAPVEPAPVEPLAALGGSDPDAWPLPGQSRLRAPVAPAVVAVPSQETLIGGADGVPLPIATVSAPDDGGAAADDASDAAGQDGPVNGAPGAGDETPAPTDQDQDQEQGEPHADTVLGGDGDDYDHLFGDTVFRSVEDAAVRLAGDEEGEDDAEAAPGPAAVPEPPAPEQPAPEAPAPAGPPAPPETPDGGLIASVPFGPGVPGTPAAASRAASVPAEPPAGPPPAPAGPVDDHDGNTIMTSDLAALREAAGTALPQFGAPAAPGAREVLALACPQGHPNPPTRQQCRTCGVALDGDPALAPRPPLGRVRIGSEGGAPAGEDQVVELDRDVVVGRRPRSSTTSADRMPRMVTVPSPQKDISRSHVQVTLEEWHVLVEDLATTNGTVLLRPGQKPRRLHPNQKEIVVDGDVLELGDGITLAFEGIW